MVVVRLTISVIFLNIVLKLSNGSSMIYNITFKYKEKMFKDSQILNIKHNVGPKRCVLDCTRHVWCDAVNYRSDRLFCELLKTSVEDKRVNFDPYFFSEKKDWIVPDDACTPKKCRDGTSCIITKDGLPCCVNIHFNLSEVAFRKSASQSSNYEGSFPASNAVDGNTGSFTHTNSENNPYWLVNLNRIYTITSINVINRGGCNCGNRLHDLDIHVGKTLFNMDLCHHYKGPGTDLENLTIKCYLTGQYDKFSILGTGILSLAEVKVMAIV